jgi:hypothetical protein
MDNGVCLPKYSLNTYEDGEADNEVSVCISETIFILFNAGVITNVLGLLAFCVFFVYCCGKSKDKIYKGKFGVGDVVWSSGGVAVICGYTLYSLVVVFCVVINIPLFMNHYEHKYWRYISAILTLINYTVMNVF